MIAPRDPQLWPTTARLAIASGLATLIRLWLYLWNADRPNSDGWIDYEQIDRERIARALGVTRQTLTRWINQGQSGPVVFWQVVTTGGGRKIRYTGQAKLGAALAAFAFDKGVRDAYELPRRKHFIRSEDLTGSLKRFQAAALAAWLADQTDHRYRATWAILSDLWKRSHVTLGGWADLAGVQRVENIARVQRPDLTQDEIPAAYALAQSQDDFLWFKTENGSVYQYYQRGNTYIAPRPTPAARGQATQIQQTIAQADRGDSSYHPAGKLAEVLAQREPNVQIMSSDKGGVSAVLAALAAGIYRAVIYYQRTNYSDQNAPRDVAAAARMDRYQLSGREVYRAEDGRTKARAVWDLLPVSN